jgi:hypothetical protein
MKKIACLSVIAFFISCATPTYITGSWKNTAQPVKSYHNVCIAALTGHAVVKSKIESDLKIALAKQNVSAFKSIDEFPPNFLKDSVSRSTLIEMVKKKGADAILTITLLKKETESRYIGGPSIYSPYSRFGYYGNFYGYYSYWYPYAYSPGYYTQNDVYYFETNLYDVQSEALIWSAQSETYSYDGLNGVSADLARTIVEKMKSDGVLNERSVAVKK